MSGVAVVDAGAVNRQTLKFKRFIYFILFYLFIMSVCLFVNVYIAIFVLK